MENETDEPPAGRHLLMIGESEMRDLIDTTNSPSVELTGRLLHKVTTVILTAAAALLSIAPGNYAVSAEKESVPNIVIILADDLGYQDLGCYGSKAIETPRLDRMAAEGVRFTSFYAQPICGPSRAAILTGCYPMRVAERGGVKHIHPVLHAREVTLAEVLRTRGYATACFGKWDLAGHSQKKFHPDLMPNRQGFDYFFGTPASNDNFVNLYRNEKLVDRRADLDTLTKRYTDEAIAFIEAHRDEPFFVYLPHTMPHTKLGASAAFRGKSRRGPYGDAVEEIDFHVGRILDALARLELDRRTYVVFVSDNGPWLIKNEKKRDGALPSDHGGSAGPLRGGKVSTWEGGVRVPCIVWGPGRVPAGETCDELATTMDFLPTFAALAGARAPDDRVVDGVDIRHLFAGRFDEADPDRALYYYLLTHLQAVRQGPWKLHLPRPARPPWLGPFAVNRHIAPADAVGFDRPVLYNLETDLGETTDLAGQYPEVVKRLLALAETAREDIGDYNRVGANMRFFDPLPTRPTVPPAEFMKQ